MLNRGIAVTSFNRAPSLKVDESSLEAILTGKMTGELPDSKPKQAPSIDSEYRKNYHIMKKLLDVGRRIDEARLDFDRTLETLAKEVDSIVKNDEINIFILETVGKENYFRAVNKKGDEIKHFPRMTYENSPMKKVLDSNQSVILSNPRESFRQKGYANSLAVPYKGNISYVLNLNSNSCNYNEEDCRLISFMLEMFSVKIENCLKYEKAAFYDPMTGLHNLTYLKKEYNSIIASCTRKKTPLAYISIDINNFKSINDRFNNHLVGDEMLRVVADILFESKRNCDILVRRNERSDEFMYLIQNMNLVDIISFLGEIDRKVEHWNNKFEKFSSTEVLDYDPSINKRARDVILSLSIGVATSDNGYDHLGSRADRAMYTAKKAYYATNDPNAKKNNSVHFENSKIS